MSVNKRRKESKSFRYWTDKEQSILLCMFGEFHVNEIARRLNRSVSSVKNRIFLSGLRKNNHYTPREIEIVNEMAGKYSAREIASVIGRSFYSVSRYCSSNNISTMRYGDNDPKVKYPDEDVLFIFQLYDEGISAPELSEKFDIPLDRIYNFVGVDYRRLRRTAEYHYTKTL
ncbi:hypothetical protein FIC68_21315 [Salmonella enterica]|nr:hypothetical protein [Salmonella enterica]